MLLSWISSREQSPIYLLVSLFVIDSDLHRRHHLICFCRGHAHKLLETFVSVDELVPDAALALLQVEAQSYSGMHSNVHVRNHQLLMSPLCQNYLPLVDSIYSFYFSILASLYLHSPQVNLLYHSICPFFNIRLEVFEILAYEVLVGDLPPSQHRAQIVILPRR